MFKKEGFILFIYSFYLEAYEKKNSEWKYS